MEGFRFRPLTVWELNWGAYNLARLYRKDRGSSACIYIMKDILWLQDKRSLYTQVPQHTNSSSVLVDPDLIQSFVDPFSNGPTAKEDPAPGSLEEQRSWCRILHSDPITGKYMNVYKGRLESGSMVTFILFLQVTNLILHSYPRHIIIILFFTSFLQPHRLPPFHLITLLPLFSLGYPSLFSFPPSFGQRSKISRASFFNSSTLSPSTYAPKYR